MARKSFDEVMKRSAEKLNFARASFMGKNNCFRNEQAYQFSASRILTSIENLMDSGLDGTRFMLDEAVTNGLARNFSRNHKNFSASDMAKLQDVDTVDIMIAATLASDALTYAAMERPFDDVSQNITFQGLKSLNNAGGISKGQVVFDPRSAIPVGLDFSRDGARETSAWTVGTSGATGINFAGDAPVILGETKVYIADDSTGTNAKLVAFDTGKLDPDPSTGLIPLVNLDGAAVTSATVNLETGDVKVITAATTKYFQVIRCVDRVAEYSGDHTIKLKSFMDHKLVTATEMRVILQSSIETGAQFNKMLRKNSQYGIEVNYTKRSIDQLTQLYTYFIDTKVVNKLKGGMPSVANADDSLDISGYYADYKSFSSTKNDRILSHFRKLTSKFLTRTGSPVTAVFVDEIAALTYAGDTDNFVPAPSFVERRDGFIGTYANIPVIRNVALNGAAGQDSGTDLGVEITVHKSVDGMAAPVAIGDYLAPYSTVAAVNPNNLDELSQALFSQVGCECVVPEFEGLGVIKPANN